MKIKVHCEICNEPKFVFPSQFKKGGKFVCGKKCLYKLSSKIQKGKKGLAKDQNPFYGKKHTNTTRQILSKKAQAKWRDESSVYNSEEYKAKRDKVAKNQIGKHIHTEEYKKKLRAHFLNGGCPSKKKEVRLKISKSKKGRKNPLAGKNIWKNGEHPRGMLGKKHSQETRYKFSIISKERWKDEAYAKKIFRNLRVFPNNSEQYLLKLLHSISSANFKYVGDGKTFIKGKNPDFIDFKKRLIIELFGDYWHDKSEEVSRRKHFQAYNYTTLIIWEHELRDKEKVISKINKFINSSNLQKEVIA